MNYPEGIVAMYPPQKDSPSTFLTAAITNFDTTIHVSNPDILPSEVPFPLTIGFDQDITETVLVEAKNGMELTVDRGPSPLAWDIGVKVARIFTADDLGRVQHNIEELDTLLQDQNNRITTNANTIAGLSTNLQEEIERAENAEEDINTEIIGLVGMLNAKQDKITGTLVTDISTVTATEAETYFVSSHTDMDTGESDTTTIHIPPVSNSTQGVMTPEAYTEISSLRTDVTALQQQGGRFIGVSFPTKAALDAYEVPATVNSGDFTFVLDDETHEDATTRYIYNGSVFQFGYVINYNPVGLATSTTPGLVKSNVGSTDGRVFVESDGEMSVIGWDALNDEVDLKANSSSIGNATVVVRTRNSSGTASSSAGSFTLNQSTNTNVDLPTATATNQGTVLSSTTAGQVSVNDTSGIMSVNTGVLTIRRNGTSSTTYSTIDTTVIPGAAKTITLPLASTSAAGLIRSGTATGQVEVDATTGLGTIVGGIPTVGNGTVRIMGLRNNATGTTGYNYGSFTLNQSGNIDINITTAGDALGLVRSSTTAGEISVVQTSNDSGKMILNNYSNLAKYNETKATTSGWTASQGYLSTSTVATITNPIWRNIQATTTDPGANSPLTTGTITLVYEV